MFKISNENIYNYHFLAALNQLSNQRFPIRVGWNISRIYKQCQVLEKKLREQVKEFADASFAKDEKGNFQPLMIDERPVPDKFIELKEGDQKIFDDKVANLMGGESELKSDLIDIKDVAETEMTPTDLGTLQALFKV